VTQGAATNRLVVGAVAAFVFSLLLALAAAWLLTDYYWYGEDLDLLVWPIAPFVAVSSVVFGTTSMRAQGEGAISVAPDGRQGALDGLRGEGAASRETLAEPGHGLLRPQGNEPGCPICLGDENADGVGAEVDPGEKPAHLGRAEARPRSEATVVRSVSRPTGFSTTASIPCSAIV